MKETFCELVSGSLAAVKRFFQEYGVKSLILIALACTIGTIFVGLISLGLPQPAMIVIMLAGLLCITTAAVYAGVKSSNFGSFTVEYGGAMFFLGGLRLLMLSFDSDFNEFVFWIVVIAGCIMAIVAAFLITLWAKGLRCPKKPQSDPVATIICVVEPCVDDPDDPDSVSASSPAEEQE